MFAFCVNVVKTKTCILVKARLSNILGSCEPAQRGLLKPAAGYDSNHTRPLLYSRARRRLPELGGGGAVAERRLNGN
eukprot:scaffold104638_cov69-Phaeocystis_antarctica.AAC.6